MQGCHHTPRVDTWRTEQNSSHTALTKQLVCSSWGSVVLCPLCELPTALVPEPSRHFAVITHFMSPALPLHLHLCDSLERVKYKIAPSPCILFRSAVFSPAQLVAVGRLRLHVHVRVLYPNPPLKARIYARNCTGTCFVDIVLSVYSSFPQHRLTVHARWW